MIGVVYYIRQKDKKNNLYVGSTTKSLEERMINHFKAFNDKTKINRNLGKLAIRFRIFVRIYKIKWRLGKF